MEIQKNLSLSPLKTAPVKPLEGYFRFRQQMMNKLPDQQRTSESIIGLWNQLSAEQKAVRLQQTRLEMYQYQMDLARWNKDQKIPLQKLKNALNQNNFQMKIELKTSQLTNPLEDIQNSNSEVSKCKPIRKLKRRISKKQQ